MRKPDDPRELRKLRDKRERQLIERGGNEVYSPIVLQANRSDQPRIRFTVKPIIALIQQAAVEEPESAAAKLLPQHLKNAARAIRRMVWDNELYGSKERVLGLLKRYRDTNPHNFN